MPITVPASLTKIKNEFSFTSEWYTDTFDAGSGTITAPAGAISVRIKAWGGGGGGYSDFAFSFGGGAGAGFSLKTVLVTGGSTQFSYSVGAGGASGADGGTSTVSSSLPSISLTATGGGGRLGSGGNVEGIGSGGDENYSGFDAVGTDGGAAAASGNGGQPNYGGGGYNNSPPGPGAGGIGNDVGYDNGASGRVSFTWFQSLSSNNLSAFTRGGGRVPNHSANSLILTSSPGLAISQFTGAEKSFSATITPADIPGGGYPPPSETIRGYIAGSYGSIDRNQVGLNRSNLATTTLLEVVSTPTAGPFGIGWTYRMTAKFSGDLRTSTLGYNFASTITMSSVPLFNSLVSSETYDGTNTTFDSNLGLLNDPFALGTDYPVPIEIAYAGP